MIYDIGIMGGGPAGYTAALEAVAYGLSVILFEKADIGGTCLNKGCIPTRHLEQVAASLHGLKADSRRGIHVDAMHFEFGEAHAEQQAIIRKLQESLTELLQAQKIVLCRQEAKLVSSGMVDAAGIAYACRNILVATGSRPRQKLHPQALNSDEFLLLDKLPTKLAILGGGVTAVEFADSFAAMGVEVTMYLRGPRILRHFDVDLARGVQQLLRQHGVQVQAKCDIGSLTFSTDTTILSANGRIPNIHADFVEESLVTLGEDGGILVDEHGETITKGIFAAGDVVSGSHQLAHTAMEEAKRIVRYIATGEVNTFRAVVSQCLYLTPEIATTGLTEAGAKAAGLSVVCAKQGMYANACTLISTGERGFIKVLAERATGKILGAQLLCERASDLIVEFALAIDRGLTVAEFASTMHPHPTFAEAITDALVVLKRKLAIR